MDATRDEPGDRDERVRVVEFWRAVEVFSPQPLPRLDTRLRVTAAGAGDPMPWEPASRHCTSPPPGKEWRHEVFGGVFELRRVRDTLTGLYGPDADGGQGEPTGGESALFACTVRGDGALIPGTAVLSSCGWAVGRALSAPGDLSLAGFGQDAARFADCLSRLADQEADPAGDRPATDSIPAVTPPGSQSPSGPTRARPAGAGDPPPRPLRGEDLRRFTARLAENLGVTTTLRPRGLRVRTYAVDADRAAEQTTVSFLNSFYADDLARVATAVADGSAGAGLSAYLTSSARIDLGRRIDVRVHPDAVWLGCLPARIPPGRWPAGLTRSLPLSQQFAVNEILAGLGGAPGLLAANGPPGTGKTTLLRDLVAAIVVARAERLAELADPAAAFGRAVRDRAPSGPERSAVTPLNPALTGLEIVVASSNNGAVENVTAEIPGPAGIGARWREAAARLDYFTATARLVHGDGAWAMIAAPLGNAASRRNFTERFWWGAPGRQDGGMVDLLGRLAGRPEPGADPAAAWAAARDEFRGARAKVAALAAERTDAAQAVIRLSVLRQDAATAQASVTAAEDSMRALVAQRAAAEGALRAAWRRYGSVVKALHAHAATKPGLRATLATRFGASREWRARRAVLGDALREHAVPVEAAQRAIADVQGEFAGAARARARAAATLRRLTAECADAQAVITRGRAQWGGHFPCGPEFSAAPPGPEPGPDPPADARRELASPWADPEFAAARTGLFFAALALHKALIAAQADRIRRNLSTLVDFLAGKCRPDDRALLAAWQTLFLVVPVVSTTFASLPAMFGGLGAEEIGWLLIDEAGQTPPQQAAGAVWRARRTVVVGDPMQLEPVATPLWGAQQALARRFDVPGEWAPSSTSVQRVAGRLMRYGTLRPAAGEQGSQGQPGQDADSGAPDP
jgi:hypothetical protein